MKEIYFDGASEEELRGIARLLNISEGIFLRQCEVLTKFQKRCRMPGMFEKWQESMRKKGRSYNVCNDQ